MFLSLIPWGVFPVPVQVSKRERASPTKHNKLNKWWCACGHYYGKAKIPNSYLSAENLIPPRKSTTVPWKRDHFKSNIVFQPSFVRGHVSFAGEYHKKSHKSSSKKRGFVSSIPDTFPQKELTETHKSSSHLALFWPLLGAQWFARSHPSHGFVHNSDMGWPWGPIFAYTSSVFTPWCRPQKKIGKKAPERDSGFGYM